MSWQPGAVVGHHYRIVRPIGRGAFSAVYLADDDRLDTRVAVKVLADNWALDGDIRRRFVNEARLLRKVRSAALVQVYDVGETERGQPYLVLEYADRGDLAARAERWNGAPAPPAEVVMVADLLATALGDLHGAGVVHRDVKPHNILIRTATGGEQLLLGDVGLAKDLAMASGVTIGGGSQGFRAPEQDATAATVTPAADVYAASAVVAWMVTGRTAAGPHEWPDLLGGVAAPLASVLRHGLDSDPARRHGSIGEWRDAVVASLGGTAGRPAPPHRLSTRRRVGTRWLVVAAVALTAVLSGAVGYIAGGTGDGDAGSGDVTRRTLADGQVQTVLTQGDAEVSITGPATLAPNEPGRYTASGEGRPLWWLVAGGGVMDAAEPLVITPVGPGRVTVRLLAELPSGDWVTVRHDTAVD